MIDAQLSSLLDDDAFWEIQQRVTRFNLFEALGAVTGELKHSNFLGYILSPSRPHGLGSQPLHTFLRLSVDAMPTGNRPVSTLELILGDLDGAVVHRERNNIDLLIEVPELELVVVIENKIRARAGVGQLSGYRTVVDQRFPKLRKLFIFLTPDGHAPDDEAYQPMSYVALADALVDLLATSSPPEATRLIIHHYVDMLRKHIVRDEKLIALAAKLYERHAEALDFIFQHKPRGASILNIVADQVTNCTGLSIETAGTNMIRFVPDAWDEQLNYKSPANMWTKSGRGLLFEAKTFNNKPGRLLLSLVLGPGNQDYRKAMYEAAKNEHQLFEGLVKPMGEQFASIFSRELLTTEAAANLSTEAQIANVQLAWSEFQADILPQLIDAVLTIDSRIAPDTPSAEVSGS